MRDAGGGVFAFLEEVWGGGTTDSVSGSGSSAGGGEGESLDWK